MHFYFYRGKVKLPSVGVCIILDVIFYIRLSLAFCRDRDGIDRKSDRNRKGVS